MNSELKPLIHPLLEETFSEAELTGKQQAPTSGLWVSGDIPELMRIEPGHHQKSWNLPHPSYTGLPPAPCLSYPPSLVTWIRTTVMPTSKAHQGQKEVIHVKLLV